MNRHNSASSDRRLRVTVIAAGGCVAALVVAGSSLATAVAGAQARVGSFTVLVTITNSELKLAPSTVPAGSVVFKILNRAKTARDFEIAGKKTPLIRAGKSATLRTLVTRPSRSLSVAPGHARLSGLLGVLAACTKPTTSTIDVQITLGTIAFSQATVPCGTVTFVVRNKEDPLTHTIHDLDVAVPTDVKGGVFTSRLRPGETATIRVSIPFKGKIYYGCQEPEHAENGEQGFLAID